MNLINEILFNLSIFTGYKTERVVNIVWELTDPSEEGFCTNSVFRTVNYWHEKTLLKTASCAIEISVGQASPLTCDINRMSHEHTCISIY